MDKALIFTPATAIEFATNIFINVPVILQYEDTPLIEVVKAEQTTRTTQLPIFDRNGTYLAKVVGTRIFPTKEGEKAGLTLRFPRNVVVCELDGKTVFELKRNGPGALSLAAELYTQDGSFIRAPSDLLPSFLVSRSNEPLRIAGITMSHCTISGNHIGILIRKDGTGGIGVS